MTHDRTRMVPTFLHRRWARSRADDERGASLLLVLVFMTALSLVINALLFGSSTSQTTTVVAASLKNATYAVDSGVEYGLEKLRANGGFCPALSGPLQVTDGTTTAGNTTVGSASAKFEGADVGLPISGGSIPLGTIITSVTSASAVVVSNAPTATVTTPPLVALRVDRPARMSLPTGFAAGQPLTVTCSGAEAGYTPQTLSSWAVVTLDPGSNSLRTQSGGGIDKQISGATYVGGKFNLQAPLQANQVAPKPGDPGYPVGDATGFVFHSNGASGGCSRPSATDLITTNFRCTSMPPPDPMPPLPPAFTSDALAPIAGPGGCRIFRPGRYRDPSRLFDLASKNYLASGVYYLEDLGMIDMDTKKVFGGVPSTAAGESSVLSELPCTAIPADAGAPDPAAAAAARGDALAGVTSGDKGVQIILGGNTRLDVDRADAEFMAFNPAVGSNQEGTGLSIRTVTASPPPGYQVWDAGGTGPKVVALKVEGGTNPHFAVHGLLYMPNASIELFATNTAQAEVRGGVLAWDLLLQSSAVGSGLLVQVAGGRPISRSAVIIEGSVPVSGSKTVKARAVVDVHVSRTVTDGTTTAGSPIVGSATAQFSEADIGTSIVDEVVSPAVVVIPSGATITEFISKTSVKISANATATKTGRKLSIDPPLQRTVNDGEWTSGLKTVRSNSAAFSGADVGGTVAGSGLPANAEITKVVNATEVEISNAATSSGNAMSLTVTRRKIVRVTVDSWRVENL